VSETQLLNLELLEWLGNLDERRPAVVGSSETEMEIIKKIMESSIFWYYIKTTSKPYSSDYYSLNGNYIKNFGVCELTERERQFLIEETNQNVLNEFFEDKYELKIS
jgi:hypothetical protein